MDFLDFLILSKMSVFYSLKNVPKALNHKTHKSSDVPNIYV